MTPEQLIETLKSAYKSAEVISDCHGYMWDEQLAQLDELIGEFKAAHAEWEENQPAEVQYAEHNTMSHVYQGTK